jgi:hypothetical protein
MTLLEQRAKLLVVVRHYGIVDLQCARRIVAGLSEEGFSIIGPEVTDEMEDAMPENYKGSYDELIEIFKAMLAAGDIGIKPDEYYAATMAEKDAGE